MVLELGTFVQFSATYIRCSANTGSYRVRKYWHTKQCKSRTGVLVGMRTLSNGLRGWIDSEEGYDYNPTEYLQAVLVAFDIHRKPVLVPIDAVQVLLPGTHSYNIVWSDEDSGYIATSPQHDGLSAFGITAPDALRELDIVINLASQEG